MCQNFDSLLAERILGAREDHSWGAGEVARM